MRNRITQLEQRFGGVKVIVGVDRLDYIKGVPQKLHALELFLTQHPEWIGKVRTYNSRFMLKADIALRWSWYNLLYLRVRMSKSIKICVLQ